VRSRARIIVTGLIAQYPLGGMTWHYLQYAIGLMRMGHDVYYLEDTGAWPYNPDRDALTDDCTYNASYLADVLERFGLGDRWAYRCPRDQVWWGMKDSARRSVLATADLIINVSGMLRNLEEYRNTTRLAFIDTDPVFTQLKLLRGQEDFRALVDAHDVTFSFGECLPGTLPATGHTWLPTRQPVVLEEWEHDLPHRSAFTTIMNWTSYKPVTFNGSTYGQKDVEFRGLMDLPDLVGPTVLEIAINAGKTKRTPEDLLRYSGWRVVDPNRVCPDLDSYRRYIQTSKAEWSVGKNGYVAGRSGWFSERSACYLAAGRPVVVQNTGFDVCIPVGRGVLAFTDPQEAAEAIREIEGDYKAHSDAAKLIARSYFDSDRVLTQLVEQSFGEVPSHG